MADLCFSLPKLKITFPEVEESNQWQLAVAGGRAPIKGWLTSVAKDLPIFCADKGIEAVLEASLVPKLLLGDCDSGSEVSYKKAEEKGAEVRVYPREKDATDLQLLLENLEEKNLCISGVWGGRFDHLYSNVFSLLSWSKKTKRKIIMADEKEIMILLQSDDKVSIELTGEGNVKAISLINFSHKAIVDLDGVKWPLKKSELDYLKPYAISNEAVSESLFCHCYNGDIGIYICLQE